MKSSKWWTALPVALVAVAALVVPSMASASRLEAGGSLIVASESKPTTIVATSSNFREENTLYGTVACTSVSAGSYLIQNDGTTFTMKNPLTGQPLEGSASGCAGAGGASIVHEHVQLTSLTASTPTNGLMGITYEWVKGTTHCKFTGTNIPFTYVSGSSSISVSHGVMSAVASCKTGTPTISGDFALKMTNGNPVTIK